jgi:hypothetical protein
VSNPHKSFKITVLYILTIIFLAGRWENERFRTRQDGSRHALKVTCSQSIHASSSDSLALCPKMYSSPHFHRVYQLFLYCNSVLHSADPRNKQQLSLLLSVKLQNANTPILYPPVPALAGTVQCHCQCSTRCQICPVFSKAHYVTSHYGVKCRSFIVLR